MSKTKLRSKMRGIAMFLFVAEFFCVFTSCTHYADSPYLQDPIPYAIEDESSVTMIKPFSKEFTMDTENNVPEAAMEWIELYNSVHGGNAAEKVIMTDDEIAMFNQKIAETSTAIYDMSPDKNVFTADDVQKMIEEYYIPGPPTVKRDGSEISWAERDYIQKNIAKSSLAGEITAKKGIITTRCELISVPSEFGFYNPGNYYASMIAETELICGFPVFVLHRSLDGEFSLVQSYYYRGWVRSEYIAHCTDEEYESFRTSQNYITVTAKKISVGGAVLDMGARLPYVTEDFENYYVSLPKRDMEGNLQFQTVSISKSDAVFGNLPYTVENYIAQAFKYLGTDYGWGGADGNVDCSGFVCAVFRSFGIYLPRNTGDQSKIMTAKTGFKNEWEIRSALKDSMFPTAIYKPGHVMLYLGTRDGLTFVIHASRSGDVVRVAGLSSLDEATSINVIK